MHRALLVASIALATSGCLGPPGVRDFVPTFVYRPTPTEVIQIVDSPADVRTCHRLAVVSTTVPTTPGFGATTEAMLQSTVALGGTDLYLERRSVDWALVRGIAYDCRPGWARERVVIRAKG